MKKLAYIILVIAILLIIGHFVKTGSETTPAEEQPAAAAVETSAVAVETPASTAETPAAENAAMPEDSDVVEVQGTAEDIIIEDGAPEDDGAIDVVETSDATTDEEETILPE